MYKALCLSISLASLVLGCGSSPAPAKTDPTKADTKADKAPTGTEGEATAENADADGETKPAASFESLHAAVLACPWSEENEIDSNCEGYEKWFDNDQPAFQDGKANPELVKMLGSKELKERRLATEKLRSTLDEANFDAKMADVLLDAAEKEREDSIVKWLALLVAEQPLAKVGKLERAIAVAKAHSVEDYTVEFLFNAGTANPDPKLLAYGVEASKSKNSHIRNGGLQLLTKLAPNFPAEACKVLDGMRADADNFVKNRATSSFAGVGKCAPYADKLLDYLSKVDVKKDLDQNIGFALNDFCAQKEPTAAQRERANKAARRISEAKAVGANTRYYTLSAVMRCDPKDGAAFVSKFKNDPDKTLVGRANELVK